MNLSDLVGPLEKIAPLAATLIGGPAGPMIGGLLSAALGVPNTPDAIHQAIQTDPEAAVKVAQIEADHKEHLQALAVQAESNRLAADTAALQASAADRADARQREIKTADRTPRILAALVVAGWIGVQFYLLQNVIDPSMRELVARVLGTLDSALMLVLSYYFGSSSGSRAKDDTISAQAMGAKIKGTS